MSNILPMIDSVPREELERTIQELRSTEEELRATQQVLEAELLWRRILTEQSRDGIVIVDEGAKVYEANQRFAAMLGYTPDEVRRLHVWDWDTQFTREELLGLAAAIDEQGHHFTTTMRRKDGTIIDVELSNSGAYYHDRKLIFCICRDVTEVKRAAHERDALIAQLQESLAEIKTLRGILPLCAFCKKVRDDRGYWEKVDVYIREHSDASVSHGICPDCLRTHYPEQARRILDDRDEK